MSKPSKFVGFKCPIDLYNDKLEHAENKSKVIITSLKKIDAFKDDLVKPKPKSVKPTVKPKKEPHKSRKTQSKHLTWCILDQRLEAESFGIAGEDSLKRYLRRNKNKRGEKLKDAGAILFLLKLFKKLSKEGYK